MKSWGRSRSRGEDGALDLVLDSRPSGFSFVTFVIFLFCHSNKYVVFVLSVKIRASKFTGKCLEHL